MAYRDANMMVALLTFRKQDHDPTMHCCRASAARCDSQRIWNVLIVKVDLGLFSMQVLDDPDGPDCELGARSAPLRFLLGKTITSTNLSPTADSPFI